MNLINFEVLKDKNSLLIFVSQLISMICDKMMSIGLIWYLTKEYSINVVPWFLAVSFLPHLMMAFFSTSFINRVGALKTVILSEFFRGAILLILFGLFYLFKLEGNILLMGLFISGFFVGLGSSLFNPAIFSLPPQLVPPEKILSLNALIDLKILILINGLSFICAGFLQLGLKIRNEYLSKAEKENSEATGPLYVLKKYPEIARMLVSFLFLNLVFTPILVMIPWYVQKIYLGDSSTLALIEGAMGVGAFVSGLYLSFSGFQVSSEKRVPMIIFVSFLFGVFFLLFGNSGLTWHGVVILFSIGALSTFLNIQILTYFQTGPLKEDEIPAIMTAVNIISAASVPLSMIFSGLIFPHISIPLFAKISGLVIIFIAFLMPKFLQGSVWKSE
jgi:MFS family permease